MRQSILCLLWPRNWTLRAGENSQTHTHPHKTRSQTSYKLIDYFIYTAMGATVFVLENEVNRTSDSSVVLCVSFALWPFRRRHWPLPSSNFPHHIQIRRPAVSLIRANVLNHLSHGSSLARTLSLLNHQHLNMALVIAVAGGNTLRDWGGWRRWAESTFSYLR